MAKALEIGPWAVAVVAFISLEHTGSGHFAVPPGVREGGCWGDTLFR